MLPHAILSAPCLLGKSIFPTLQCHSNHKRGIIGPLLVTYGAAFGTEDPQTGLVSYYSASDEFTSAVHPSPRYWLLWPGIACMVAVSLTGVCCIVSMCTMRVELNSLHRTCLPMACTLALCKSCFGRPCTACECHSPFLHGSGGTSKRDQRIFRGC